jgi:hypothetical protein
MNEDRGQGRRPCRVNCCLSGGCVVWHAIGIARHSGVLRRRDRYG